MRIKLALIAALLVAATLSSGATAAVNTLSYDGVVRSKGAPAYQVTGFQIGDPFQVTYSFNSDAADINPNPKYGAYNAITALSFTVGGYSGYLDPGQMVYVANDYTDQGGYDDYYSITVSDSTLHGPQAGDWSLIGFNFQLLDPTHSAFSTDSLPTQKLNPADFVAPGWTFMGLTFRRSDGATSSVVADFSPVPEPSSLAGLVAGVGCLIPVIRRRR